MALLSCKQARQQAECEGINRLRHTREEVQALAHSQLLLLR
jgi:hypothetical protein